MVDLVQEVDFIGKEELTRIEAQSIQRTLVGVEIGGDAIPFNMTPWPVRQNGTQVGQITSAIHSPRLHKNIGYAWAPIDEAALGTGLDVTLPQAGDRSDTVVRKLFVDPEKHIPKS